MTGLSGHPKIRTFANGRTRSPNQRNVLERCDLRSAVGQQKRDEVEEPIEAQPWSMRNQAFFFLPDWAKQYGIYRGNVKISENRSVRNEAYMV